MMDGSWGVFGGWGFLWFLLLLGIIVLAVSMASGNEGAQNGGQQDRAQEELRKQYARGELSDEEFEKRRRKL
ncbi:SHOCT domain-containing protein [Natronolimnohabitans sp. A-GB9]|uniref:SHOCT domain-containing protein n=1 Tax=Natronolimnohabitans sp. A-GB9 TaxID=3069757 RepID=UPI0027B1B65E|nr:SHOCT domain-containing protein [Natronolimnohabitans sp. A-GB9]MDQ2051714.1 SHOCT domain-containing protein [Natronolimnohabitans sp. A-GB9]